MERARVFATVASIVLIGVTVSPLVREPYDDGFPLSTYPMFASKRPTTLTLHYALGQAAAGERVILTPGLVGTGEVLQAMRVLDRAVGGGRAETLALCEAIAARVAADADYTHVRRIRIVTGTHDALLYLGPAATVGREIERLRCEVKR